jgi:hypothetical protein
LRKGTGLKQMAQKILLCFANISAEILQHILSYTLCAQCHILAHVCQNAVAFKASKIICAKATLLWHQK